MVFQEQTYSVLVVSSAQKFNDILAQMLPGSAFYPVVYAGNIAAARRELVNKSYDMVIINSPLADDTGARFAIDATEKAGTVVLLLVRGEAYEQIEARVSAQGVFLLAKPIPMPSLGRALKWMTAARERLRKLEQKATTVEEKMEEIRLVNRAKWLLIEHSKMSEADAHRHIEKQAMDRCLSRREIARQIIGEYSQ